jgi:hypothetical protein
VKAQFPTFGATSDDAALCEFIAQLPSVPEGWREQQKVAVVLYNEFGYIWSLENLLECAPFGQIVLAYPPIESPKNYLFVVPEAVAQLLAACVEEMYDDSDYFVDQWCVAWDDFTPVPDGLDLEIVAISVEWLGDLHSQLGVEAAIAALKTGLPGEQWEVYSELVDATWDPDVRDFDLCALAAQTLKTLSPVS